MIGPFLYYSCAAIAIVMTAFGVGIGESFIAHAAIKALDIQPAAKTAIGRASLLGMALTETAGILGFVISTLLLFLKGPTVYTNTYYGISMLGIVFAIACSGFVVGIASSFPAQYALLSIARQPFFSNKIVNLMLLSMSFIQTPIIFGFIISLFIWFQAPNASTITDAIRLIASGLSIGIGGIGPAIGLALFAKTACSMVGYNRKAYPRLISFTFISQALIETPIVFALVTSLLLLTAFTTGSMIQTFAFIAAAISIGIGNTAPGIASARTAAGACTELAKNPEHASTISNVSMIAQGFIDSCAIYAWLISMLLIILVRQ